MAIKIIDEGDIEVTAREFERYLREWNQACAYTVNPPTLENYIRGQKKARRDMINAQ